jgi:selenoprotein W-related protein
MGKPALEIEYCSSCNYLPRALWVAAELLPDLQHDISAFNLIPGTRGVFEVKLASSLVYSKAASGRFPEPEELKQKIFEQLESAR